MSTPQDPYGQQPDPYAQHPPDPYGQGAVPGGQPGYGGYGQAAPAPAFASWSTRVVTWLWDYVVYLWPAWVLYVVGIVLLVIGAGLAGSGSEGAGVVLILLGSVVLLAGIVVLWWRIISNYMIDQGRTGYTYGRRKTGTRCVREADGQAPGVGSCVGRFFLHAIINNACYIDYLWPLWDERRQTITDKILTTVVVHDR